MIYPDRHWLNPIADGTPANPSGPLNLPWRTHAGDYLDLDARIWFFTDYYSISPGMISQIPGKGAKYMIAFTDSAGAPLSGGSNYACSLPPNIPAANFWSVTLYDAENASGLANGQPFPSLGSRDKPAQNADGSTDLYLGPKAPEGKDRQLARDCAGQGVFRHPPALWPDRSRHQQELEARRHREGEVTLGCGCRAVKIVRMVH